MSKSGAHILVVDDEIEIVRALKRSLTAHGYTVFTASSGEEAIKVTSEHRPDLLLLDLLLPGMSGLEVCRLVRAESNMPILSSLFQASAIASTTMKHVEKTLLQKS
jgi:two-component system, OmpR family, KDP operon response regulator KdpE